MPEDPSLSERSQNRRRRLHPPRNNKNKNASQRNYASENDMSSMENNIPRTPKKSTPASPAPLPASQNQGSTKRGGKDKARPKHLPLSPKSAQTNRQTSPQPSSIPKPGNATAFAGATFHASPAPSSLPLPSFFSKAPASPALKEENHPGPDMFQASSKAAIPTPSHASPSPLAHESPLEFIFKADREERERARLASGGQAARPRTNIPYSPTSISPTRKGTTPGLEAQSPSPIRYSRPDMARSTPELDSPFGNTMPYQERIRAARNSSAMNGMKTRTPNTTEPLQTQTDKSDALKRYLFGSSQPTQIHQTRSLAPAPKIHTPPAPVPTAQTDHAGSSDVRDADVVALENNLRRLLNLDSSVGTR